jgi:hypothetical protein
MTLSQSTLSVLAIAALAVAILALLMAAGLGRRLRQVRRSYSVRHRSASTEPAAAGEVEQELAEVRDVLSSAIQRIGLVRFDAFEDMGGRLSFAVALLDADGTGVVFSSINGRNETRIYAKPIEFGSSRIALSDEENESIRRALGHARV